MTVETSFQLCWESNRGKCHEPSKLRCSFGAFTRRHRLAGWKARIKMQAKKKVLDHETQITITIWEMRTAASCHGDGSERTNKSARSATAKVSPRSLGDFICDTEKKTNARVMKPCKVQANITACSCVMTIWRKWLRGSWLDAGLSPWKVFLLQL